MKNLGFVVFVWMLFVVAVPFAQAQKVIQVDILNGTFGQYSDLFLAKLTVEGNAGGSRGTSLTTIVPHAEIYWDFSIPTNDGEVMITANAIPGYKIGDPIFVPYDPSGAFCYLVINPDTRLVVDLLVTEDASGPHCSIR
jgi:hypothetical protein